MKSTSLLAAALAVSQLIIQPLAARAGVKTTDSKTTVVPVTPEKGPPLLLFTPLKASEDS